jgi:hypothetical protein
LAEGSGDERVLIVEGDVEGAVRVEGVCGHSRAQDGTSWNAGSPRAARTLAGSVLAVTRGMRLRMLLPALCAGLVLLGLLGLYACGNAGTGAGEQGPQAEGGADAGPPAEDSFAPPGPCGWSGLAGLDAACAVGSDCPTGQVCLVAEGCFCASEGRCFEPSCEGGVLSTACAESTCRAALSGSADPDAGVISCFVSGC